ncbi:hypothetical protein C8T65DRAFT_97516 [Cerioporus squamosus]|nr:hypothetical protein C8T65DRAFT_97516 [Cerioporus squamosus]
MYVVLLNVRFTRNEPHEPESIYHIAGGVDADVLLCPCNSVLGYRAHDMRQARRSLGSPLQGRSFGRSRNRKRHAGTDSVVRMHGVSHRPVPNGYRRPSRSSASRVRVHWSSDRAAVFSGQIDLYESLLSSCAVARRPHFTPKRRRDAFLHGQLCEVWLRSFGEQNQIRGYGSPLSASGNSRTQSRAVEVTLVWPFLDFLLLRYLADAHLQSSLL